MTRATQSTSLAPSVVYALGYHTWADGVRREMSWSPDRIAQHMCADPDISMLIVVDPLRSQLSRFRRRPIAKDAGFPASGSRVLVHPRRWRRRDSFDRLSSVHAYERLDRWLRRRVIDQRIEPPILVSCHPVLAAVANRSFWVDVIYYGWDDWLSYPPYRRGQNLFAWSYERMAAQDVNVIGVTAAIVQRIGARRSWVIPNGIAATDFEHLGATPVWFSALSGPIALYAGSLESRIDIEALVTCARDLPGWTFALVGHMRYPELFAPLAKLPNVVVRPAEPRPSVLKMMTQATVCLIPHRQTPMTVAMSPLKLYEYLGSGAAVVATDLPPLRGVSNRCLLVEQGAALAPAVLKAADLPAATRSEILAFRRDNDWSRRYESWRSAALGL